MTTTAIGQDRRGEQRMRCLKGARVLLRNGNSTLACRIHDRSAMGVRLKADQTSFIPTAFTLVQDGATDARLCVVSWRGDKEIGARIVGETVLEHKGYNRSNPLIRMRREVPIDRYPV